MPAIHAFSLSPGLRRGLLLGVALVLALLSWAVSAAECPGHRPSSLRLVAAADAGPTALALPGAPRGPGVEAASVTTAAAAACALREPAAPRPAPGACVDPPEFAPAGALPLQAALRLPQAWPQGSGLGHPNAPRDRLLRPPSRA